MTETDCRIVSELGSSIQRFSGTKVQDEVMEGSEGLTPSSSGNDFAEWVRSAVERLDSLVDEATRIQIMHSCGHNCSLEYQEIIQFARERFRRSKDLDEFLRAEQNHVFPGTKLRREGSVLIQVYSPTSFIKPMRCYCHLMRDLPSSERVSLTYCHCAEGFIKSYWESILGRPVRVEIQESTLSGGKECRFAIHLQGDAGEEGTE